MSWQVSEVDDGNRHVSPILDQREHDMSVDCWCRPRHDEDDPSIIIHNSLDRRELH